MVRGRGGGGGGSMDHCDVVCESAIKDSILGDDALLCSPYVMLIWAPFIPATRWNCSQPADGNDC